VFHFNVYQVYVLSADIQLPPLTIRQVVEINGDSNGAVIAHSTLKPGSKFDYNQQSGEVTP
jgi:hypothetical protein